MYEYRLHRLVRVVDADTFDVDLDLGFYTTLRVRIRLNGVNAPERDDNANLFATSWLTQRMPGLLVRTVRPDPSVPVPDGSFGRWAASVYDDHDDLALDLVDAGHAEPT